MCMYVEARGQPQVYFLRMLFTFGSFYLFLSYGFLTGLEVNNPAILADQWAVVIYLPVSAFEVPWTSVVFSMKSGNWAQILYLHNKPFTNWAISQP